MTLTQWLAIWFIASVVSAPFIGNLLHKRRVNRELRGHLESERRRVRLEKLVELADELEAAPTSTERQRIYRRAEALGFVVTEQDKAWEGAFALDEPSQPRPAA